VQDPGEPGIGGVVVSLNTPNGIVTTTTDANGFYIFKNEGASGPYSTTLRANTAYTLTIDPLQTALLPYTMTIANAQAVSGSATSNDAILDVRDSDASNVGGLATIYYTTGTAGQNNHGLDFGFYQEPAQFGDRVWIESDADGNANTGSLTPVAGMVITATSGATVYTTTTDADGYYSFTVPGGSYTVSYGPVPASYGAVIPSATPGGNNTSGNAGVYQESGNPDQSHEQNTQVTVAAGQANWTVDFAFTPAPAQFGDRVWIESDTDGNANTGTLTPVAGMVITATSGANVYTTTTDANGYYSFTVPAGTYTVNYGPVPASYGPVVVSGTPAGATASGNAGSYAQTGNPDQARPNGATVTVAAGEANWSIDFAFTPQLYDLGNRVWFDNNNDGVLGSGEQPVAGALMQLKNVTGTVLGTTTTDANGYYSFTNLAAGDYIVTVAAANFGATGVLSDYTSSDGATAPSNTAGDNNNDHGIDPANRAAYLADGVSSGTIRLGPGLPTGEDTGSPATPNGDANNNQTIDFGFYKLKLGNLIWEDYNNDGDVDAGEPGIDGVIVELRTPGGTVVSTTTTSGGGMYLFTGLAAGDYVVALPASNFAASGALSGLTSSTGTNGASTGAYEPGIGETNDLTGDNRDHGSRVGGEVRSGTITLAAGTEPINDASNATSAQPTIDFGLFRPAQVGNYVWYDDDKDGQQTPGEQGVPGVTVTLLLNGTPVSNTVTAANGNYSFTNLISGTNYSVRFELPNGMTFTTQLNNGNADGVANDSDAPAGANSGTTAAFDLGYGEAEPDIDAGVFIPAGLGDVMWIDLDGDGVQDNGEQPVAGQTVTLLKDDGSGNFSVYSTTQTSNTGYYWFGDLPVGTYIVSFTLPSGYTWTVQNGGVNVGDNSDANPATGASAPVTLGRGESNPRIDAGVRPYASLGNYVWVDSDQDGVQDNGAASGLNGVTVRLLDANGGVLGTTTTQNDAAGNPGYYTFTNLVSGTYRVEFLLPAGMTWTITTPSSTDTSAVEGADNNVTDPATGRTELITLNWGDVNPAIDAGVRPLGSLGNRVWFDTNNDGIDNDGAGNALGTGVSGVTVELYVDTNNDNVYSAGDTLVGTTTTDASGYYSFTNLVGGDYLVVLPASNFNGGPLTDYRNSDPTVTGNSDQNERDHGVPAAAGHVASSVVTLDPGNEPVNDGDADNTSNLSIDFGFYTMNLGNRVWIDANNNGVIDPDEAPVAGATVTLYAGDGTTVISTTTTDAGGYYTFTALAPGDYIVGVMPPTGYVSSSGAGQEADPNANGDSNDNGVVTMASGEIRSGVMTMSPGAELDIDAATGTTSNWTVDFGVWQPAALGNYVWRDDNRDGVQNEPVANGVNGVTVRLLDPNGNVVSTTVTANDPLGAPGYYTFTNLVSGTYRVEFVLTTLPAGATPTGQDAGSDDALDSDADPLTGQTVLVTINAGEAIPTIDMGIQMPVGLGDYVWFDLDKNGQQNVGEPPVSGVTVTLYSGGQVVSTTVTNSTGYYQFVQLQPNTPYTLSFALPDGYVWTAPGTTSSGTTDSNVDADGVTAPVTLAPGEFNGTIDAGIISPVVIDKSASGSGASNTIGADGLITYTLSVRNTSAQLVSNVMISDPLPSAVTYVAGTSQPAEAGTAPLTWQLAQIAPNDVATITFVVQTNGVPPATIRNIAYAMQGGQLVAQDNADILARPTAVSLDRFEVLIGADGAQTTVRWSTALELNTLGFNVWRSTGATRADAVKVNASLIAAKGASGGRYEVVDSAAGAYYWLEERELNGTVNWYGPVALGAPAQATAAIRVETVASAVLIPAQGAAPAQTQSIVKVEAAPVVPRADAIAAAAPNVPVGQVVAQQPLGEAPAAASPLSAVEPEAIVEPAKPGVASQTTAATAVEATTVNGRVAEPETLRIAPRAVVTQPAPAMSVALPIALAAAALLGLFAAGCVGVVMLRRRK
jgi:uncharacterized repeat protein (TIGR01451 family)